MPYGPIALFVYNRPNHTRKTLESLMANAKFSDSAKKVADRVIFMDAGQIIEENNPEEFFNNPQSERTQLFLSQIIDH